MSLRFPPKPPKDPWEDPSLGVERESHATHRRRKEREARRGEGPSPDSGRKT